MAAQYHHFCPLVLEKEKGPTGTAHSKSFSITLMEGFLTLMTRTSLISKMKGAYHMNGVWTTTPKHLEAPLFLHFLLGYKKSYFPNFFNLGTNGAQVKLVNVKKKNCPVVV